MGYSSAQAKAFIDHIAPIMQEEAKRRGYRVISAAIAQAVIEGAAGTSKLAKYHNHWGIKCGNAWKGKSVNMTTKEEYQPGVLTNIKDNFRVWDSDAEGVAGYYDFISTKRYQGQYSTPLRDCSSYREYAEALKKCGYATSSTYVNTLCSTVQKYDLTRYDGLGTFKNPVLSIGSKGEYVKHVQLYLSLLGYQVGKIDSIYGIQTANCVKEYRMEKGLSMGDEWDEECWGSVGK